jgi:ADP-ribose pyrophosphatase YjhB (NUDIX family)
MEAPKHSVSVAAVITDDQGRALLIQRRDNGHWEPPGGVLELEETIEDGLRREVQEETGLDTEPQRLTGVYKNMNRAIVALVFRCAVTGGHLVANEETVAFRWADKDQLCELTDEAYRIRILDALVSSTASAVRHHDGTSLLHSR